MYALDTQSFRMRKVVTRGLAPGWIQRHRAILAGDEIRVSGDVVSSQGQDGEAYEANEEAFALPTARAED